MEYSPKARRALVLAEKEASRVGSPFIGVEHILKGITLEKEEEDGGEEKGVTAPTRRR